MIPWMRWVVVLSWMVACGEEPAPTNNDGGSSSSVATSSGATSSGATSDGATSDGASTSTTDASSTGAPLPAEEVLWSDRLLNIAHAGGKGTRPEHTMIAYETALADGADVLELDVHATSDGVLVLMHDETVDRTTDGTGAIKEMTLAELRELDAGYRFTMDDGATFPYRGMGLRVPTLEETLAAFPDVPYVIEIKQGTPSIVEPFLAMCDEADVLDQMVASAFDVNVLEEIRVAAPEMPTSFGLAEVVELVALTDETEADYVPPAAFLQVPPNQGGIEVLTPALVERAHRLDLKVHAWTINDEAEMRALVDMGIDGIITDFPARLRDLEGD